MSSPKVLTFSNAPHAEARSSNEREIAYYLALVSGVEARLRARLATLTVRGISLGLDFSTEALRCEVLPLPSGADGS